MKVVSVNVPQVLTLAWLQLEFYRDCFQSCRCGKKFKFSPNLTPEMTFVITSVAGCNFIALLLTSDQTGSSLTIEETSTQSTNEIKEIQNAAVLFLEH